MCQHNTSGFKDVVNGFSTLASLSLKKLNYLTHYVCMVNRKQYLLK